MPLPPIVASLTRHKLTALLLMLQVSLTCAIVCNVAFMIVDRVQQLHHPSGVAENELVMIESTDLDQNAQPLVRHATDLTALRAIPGVTSVAVVDAMPFNHYDWSNGIALMQDGPARATATAFNGTPGELTTLGLHLVEGRDFLPNEYVPLGSAHDWNGIDQVPVTIVTRALADKLFPGQDPLGKAIYPDEKPVRIVGVIDHLLRPQAHESADSDDATVFPMLPDGNDVTYVLRTAPQDRERVLKQAAEVLDHLHDNRILRHAQTFEQLRADFFHRSRTMIALLMAAALGLLVVTALGIAGLASFWVQQRRRSIGIRRAVGATRRDILRYFQLENFLIVGAGVTLGTLLAYGLNMLLMQHYEQPRLPLLYLAVGALALWLLGQLAVLGPALRAASVPPVVATRGA
ncbi:ABC transporter permease [Dyella nitratireducens]|uniref:ABC transporter permease n=1 Tax=Dyella nitratireducens TaxID=1849580 RepID=A0ABQ1FQU0_9GAMM|nr:FtsX-like permease family protein [Dyella nitratireducens]GGA27094.1 ABC transporter permease [Dyella nitratireducens]GLQ43463.1 ABC transporter permease [Dyella nitratireducens]